MIPERVVQVAVGVAGAPGRLWDQTLYVEFEIEQTKQRAPDRADVSMYNLSDDSIAFLHLDDLVLQVLAGETIPSLLYRGDIPRRGVVTEVVPPNRRTDVRARAGRTAFAATRFDRTYPPGVSSSLILADLQLSFAGRGLVLGYLDPAIVPISYPGGYAFSGKAVDILGTLCDDLGAEYYVHGGTLSIVSQGSAIPGGAVVVSAATGMRRAPTRTDKGIAVETTLTPQIRPGAIVQVVSVAIPTATGFYRVTRSVHRGDSRGSTWQTEFEGAPL